MGQAYIQSGGDRGRYAIALNFDAGQAAAKLPDIEHRLAEVLPVLIAAADVAVDGAVDALLAAQSAYDNSPTETRDECFFALQEAKQDLLRKKRSKSDLEVEKAALELTKEHLERAIEEDTRDVWCADLTESLEAGAAVGTIEVNGDSRQILINHGGENIDSRLQKPFVSTPAAVFYNWAIMPWWQRWRPTYRIATITDIDYDNDTCSVVLREAVSSLTVDQHGYPREGVSINPEDLNLLDVPVHYMECNAGVFAIDDSVVVQFSDQDWGSPVIVGFEENPRPCLQSIPVQLFNAEGSAAFLAVADQRIAEIDQDIAHADYFRNVFIPEALAYYDSLLDKYWRFVYGIAWQKINQSDIDRWTQPFKDWRDTKMGANENLGYGSYVAAANQVKNVWQEYKDAATYAHLAVELQYLGTKDPEDEEPGSPIANEPVMVIDCAVLTDVPDNFEVFEIIDEIQRGGDISNAAAELWEVFESYEVPPGQGKLYVDGMIEFVWEAMGIIYDGKGYIVSRNFFLSADVPETTEIVAHWQGGGLLFRYPSPHDYSVTIFDLDGDFDTEAGIQLDIGVYGRPVAIPTEFGGEVVPAVFSGNRILETGGPTASDPHTWAGKFLRERTVVPRGFESFAGRYPDHPIVTGINPSCTATPEQGQLEYVNNYVQTTYEYIPDEENYDYWQFLSKAFPAGDCEDFALTKIQMLLERGWDIARLRLMAGFRAESYSPPIFDTDGREIFKYIGHVWVVVDDSIALDSSVTTRQAMIDAYPIEVVLQTQGLWWLPVGWTGPGQIGRATYVPYEYDSARGYRAIPLPHYDIDTPVMTMKARHRDYPPSE